MSKIVYEGYWDDADLPIKAEDKVTLIKGMVYTHNGEEKTVGRKYTVTVHHILCGITNTRSGPPKHTMNPQIVWAGSGGYWSTMDINEYLNKGNHVGT